METKLFEIRDRDTFIPMLAVLVQASNEAERYLIRVTGYGKTVVILTHLCGEHVAHYDSHNWSNSRIGRAHRFIENCWDDLVSGDVIDIEYIQQETTTKKRSQRYDA